MHHELKYTISAEDGQAQKKVILGMIGSFLMSCKDGEIDNEIVHKLPQGTLHNCQEYLNNSACVSSSC